MSQSLIELARQTVADDQARGAEAARASVVRNRSSKVEWRDGKLDRLRESTRMALGITLYVNGRYSANGTSDLRPEALARFLDQTIAATRVLARDEHRKLPEPERYRNRFSGELGLLDEAGLAAVRPMDRRRAAERLEQAARAAQGAERIISVTTSCSDGESEAAMVTSNGMAGSQRDSSFSLGAQVSVRGEGHRKPVGWWASVARHRSGLDTIEAVGKEATRRALANVGARPEKSGRYRCIIENAVAGRLLGGLLAPLSGSAIQQQRSFLADKLGQRIGSPRLSINDDPLLPRGLGSCTYDSEGMSTLPRPILEKGVLRTFFLDTYYASKLGREPTTGSWSNLVFPAGRRDLPRLLAAMDTGILVTSFSGGNSNAATGDFSIGIRGQWVEGGRIVRPVSEMNLAGNHLSFWQHLSELGSDPYPYSSMRCPSLRFEPVQFSGT